MSDIFRGQLPQQRRPGGPPGADRRPDRPPTSGPVRRVRHVVRDGLAVALFSAAASTALAGGLLLLARLVG